MAELGRLTPPKIKEETGLDVHNVRPGAVINVVDEATNYHYVAVFMVAEAGGGCHFRAEPLKCEGWHWVNWAIDLPTPVFATLAKLRALGFNPTADAGVLSRGAAAEPSRPSSRKAEEEDPKADADAIVALATAV